MQLRLPVLNNAPRAAQGADSGLQIVKAGLLQGRQQLPSQKGNVASLRGSLTSEGGILPAKTSKHPSLMGKVRGSALSSI